MLDCKGRQVGIRRQVSPCTDVPQQLKKDLGVPFARMH
jgi:hypothetical protein